MPLDSANQSIVINTRFVVIRLICDRWSVSVGHDIIELLSSGFMFYDPDGYYSNDQWW